MLSRERFWNYMFVVCGGAVYIECVCMCAHVRVCARTRERPFIQDLGS